MWINHDHIAPGTGARAGRPDLAFNDVIAHEFGHIIDWIYAGDRVASDKPLETDSVEEALADMFAYDFDREDATIAEEIAAASSATGKSPAESLAATPRSPTPPTCATTTPPRRSTMRASRSSTSTPPSSATPTTNTSNGSGTPRQDACSTTSRPRSAPDPPSTKSHEASSRAPERSTPKTAPTPGTRSDAREAAEQAFDLVGIHIRDHRGEQPG